MIAFLTIHQYCFIMNIVGWSPLLECIIHCMFTIIFMNIESMKFFGKNLLLSKVSCLYAWPHTWWLVTNMPITLLGLMYVFRLLYTIGCFRVMACLGFQLCWHLYKRPISSLLLLVFLKFLWQGRFSP